MLFDPLHLRSVQLRNRIAVSPMCQYSATDGMPSAWHLVHLGSRAVGGAGLVMVEASAVTAEGRISPGDAGIYSDAHVDGWAPIAHFIAEQGAVPGIQLAHAGRKASTDVPWNSSGPLTPERGGWTPIVAPSAIAFDQGFALPLALDAAGIGAICAAFAAAARRAFAAGFRLIEIHAAHGYLLHEFLSPLSNQRSDPYGGSLDNRCRIVREVVAAVRTQWPESLPLFLRISATDWAPDDSGWRIEDSIELARMVKDLGVDLIDVSSGGTLANARIHPSPGYQVPFAARIRREAGIATGAVGAITAPAQAEQILANGEADLVLLAREMLRDPYWPYRAAKALHADFKAPVQYSRGW